MEGDRIWLNDRLASAAEAASDIDALLSANYIYQDIQTLAHASPFLERHLQLAGDALLSIHGRNADGELACTSARTDRQCGGAGEAEGRTVTPHLPSVEQLAGAIREVLRENRYPTGSALVRLYLVPDRWMASCVRQQLYDGMVLWHNRLRAISLRYEAPFASRQCAVSLMCAGVADAYAARCGAEICVRSDHAGVLSSAGDHTLVAVAGRVGYLTPLGDGAPEEVYRDVAIDCFARAKIELRHEAIREEVAYDEMMVFGPQGITSLKSLDEQMFYNTAALKLSLALPKM